jgi:hypothetical protein
MPISERCSRCARGDSRQASNFAAMGSRKPDALARTLLANVPQLVDAWRTAAS